MADNQTSEKKISFKDTLNLPQTDFPIRANAKIDDPEMIKRWEAQDLFSKSFDHNKGKNKFILHDGPPYANGHIHIGHAYNKILKDIVAKSQRMFGKHVPVTPGWDCHGLPIELQVTKENPGLDSQNLKNECRKYAQKWIDVQLIEFKNLGVLMDWKRPYLTMDYGYEASILRAFAKFVEFGYIERKNKTVPWCMSCQTVLASAEIEYQERKDPSIYVLFPLEQEVVAKLFPQFAKKEVNLVIWTTTPWTLPLNRAVLLKPNAQYVLLEVGNKYIIVGKQLADKLCDVLGVSKKVMAEFISDELVSLGARAQHPFIKELHVPLILDQSVMLDEGTAFVHCAPGAGPEDYETGVKNNLEIYSPVGPDGNYVLEVNPTELAGMSVADGQIWVIKKLASLDRLLFKNSIRHPYPHCWRCHNGLIFRATKQWFCDLSKDGLKQKVLEAIETIETVPEKSINRLKATVEGRLEWCLSRQRIWGVPIPALLCQNCDYSYITREFVEKVADNVQNHGVAYWDSADIAELLPKDFKCPACKDSQLKKEQDILDVWFDSGVSHFAVLAKRPELGLPADMYLEGKDQHRGWFQSSLLTAMVLNGHPPMKTIVTHGFTVDEKGRKMSKSLGNVVAPKELIDKIGTDGLRLWASSNDVSGEAVVSDVLIRNVQEVFRKIRNTARFLLSNLYDFDIEKDALPLEQLYLIDQYALQDLYELNFEVLKSYYEYDFTAVFHKLGDYCAVNLSSFYLDIVKDRLYVEQADGFLRRSAQTTCWYILDTLTRLMAPILSFTAEQISDNYQGNKQESIHLQSFTYLENIWDVLTKSIIEDPGFNVILGTDHSALSKIKRMGFTQEHMQRWDVLKSIRSALLKAIEQQREKDLIKHPLEAHVTIHISKEAPFSSVLQDFFELLEQKNQTPGSFFKEFVIVSAFDIADHKGDLVESSLKGLFVKVDKARGDKCPRCWHWEPSQHEHKLCHRCQNSI